MVAWDGPIHEIFILRVDELFIIPTKVYNRLTVWRLSFPILLDLVYVSNPVHGSFGEENDNNQVINVNK